MSEHQPEFRDPEAAAPARLVEALRRLDSQRILVTQQTDELVLDRPRLHLARVRQLRAMSQQSETESEEDLALAAHAQESRIAGPRDFGSVLPPDSRRSPRGRWWHPILLGGATAFAAAAVASVALPQSDFAHTMKSIFSPVGMAPAIPLFVASLALFATWLGTRSS